jgi:hypothetical protein
LNFIFINILVKYFNSYITEIFEQAYPWRLWSSGDMNMDYQFDVMRLRGSGEWIPDPGPEFTPGVPRSIATTQRILGAYRKNTPAERQRIVVQFTQYRGTTAFGDWQRVNRGLARTGQHIELPLWERIWELGFATYVDTDGSGFDKGTDDDLGGTDTRHVVRVFGSIIQIIQDFMARKRPEGIMWGTKAEARPVRALIYNGIAKRLTGSTRAKLYSIPAPRSGIANTQVAWFSQTSMMSSAKKMSSNKKNP